MRKYWITVLLIALAVTSFAIASPAHAGRLYWSRSSGDDVGTLDTAITSVRTNGSGLADHYENPDILINAIDVDSTRRGLYWIEDDFQGFKLVHGDAHGCQQLPVDGAVQRIALDETGGKIYWTEYTYATGVGRIRRAGLDLSAVEVVLDGLNGPREIDIDPIGGKIYWFNEVDNTIMRSNLDGSNVEVQFAVTELRGMQVDPAGQKIYWADWSAGGFRRADFDGSNVEDLAPQVKTAFVVDPGAGKVYWQDEDEIGPLWAGTIKRADLDGSNESIVTQGYDAAARYIALDPVGEAIPIHCGLPVPAIGLRSAGFLVLLLIVFGARALLRS
jgi:hypothetical protein